MTIRRIYARDTTFGLIEETEAFSFVDTHHRQGAVGRNLRVVSVGLSFGDELVAVAQFCAPRTARVKREYSVELLRMAFKDDVRVVGGASKLLKRYIEAFDPSDVFTYQDTTGEVTDVYEKAGFRLARTASKKQYLIAPGKTLATAERGEYYSMAQIVSRGPDALLGTSLGQKLSADGKRMTNPQLFTDELGWHLEETSGDRVYEWINPERTFYTYKITASDSEKYYYGVSHLKKAHASQEECLTDGYFGSGGKHKRNKFTNWKLKHDGQLRKEIIGTYDRQALAYEAERALVGELHRTDPSCLNSTTGGKDGGLRLQRSVAARGVLECPKHGKTFHQGAVCASCNAEKRFSLKTCAVHGEVKHSASHCVMCMSAKTYTQADCSIHGVTTHKTGKCVKCHNSQALSMSNCSIHGETKFIGSQCYRCIFADGRGFSEQVCEKHGLTKFRGATCAKCSSRSAFTQEECATHGLATHRSGVCQKCKNAESVAMLECERHGITKHQGKTCGMCSGEKVRHARSHKTTSVPGCRFCEAS